MSGGESNVSCLSSTVYLAEIWAAAVGAAVAVAGAGLSASGALSPNQPNLASSSAALSNANAALLPVQRQLQAAAAGGTKVTVNMPDGKGGSSPQTFDFRGYSSADANAAVANTMAKATLSLRQQYDPQFISQSLQDEALADPQSVAARQQESNLIQQQINQPISNPVASTLDSQVKSELDAANNHQLDPMMKGVLDSAVSSAQSDRGDSGMSPQADFEAPLTTGFAGQAEQTAANQKALSWLSSGETPQDVTYRQQQQNLANLSDEVSGATPESEFKSLSGAQQGATPTGTTSANLSQLPTNTGQVSANGAISQYQAQLSQTPSWMAGLTSLINGVSSVANASGATTH